MRVAHGRVEEDPADQGQDGIAYPAVRPRHRARFDASEEPVADHQVAAVAQLVDQRRDRGEVIAVVGVAHDYEATSCGIGATNQRAAVALPGDLDHSRAQLPRDHLRAVGAAVVSDDDLGVQTAPLDRLLCFLDAGRERLGLVQAGHDDRNLDRLGRGGFMALGSSLRDSH